MSAQILIVNHFDAVREMLAEILRYHDYDVSVVRDSAAAIQLCEEQSPDLMVLAAGNPGLDAISVAESLHGRVPFLIHSDLPDSSGEVKTLYALGAVGKLTNGPRLHDVIATALRGVTSEQTS